MIKIAHCLEEIKYVLCHETMVRSGYSESFSLLSEIDLDELEVETTRIDDNYWLNFYTAYRLGSGNREKMQKWFKDSAATEVLTDFMRWEDFYAALRVLLHYKQIKGIKMINVMSRGGVPKITVSSF
jgi:hypothetical protein